MKRQHLVPCVAVLLVAAAVLLLLGVNAGTVGFAAIALLCPVMMVGMMAMMGGGMMGHGRDDRDRDHTDVR
jgi:hypothetical protein